MACSSSTHSLTAMTMILLIIQSSAYTIPCSSTRTIAEEANTEFIKTSCDTTIYPQLCFRTLSNHANEIQSDPKLLAITALSVALEAAHSTSTFITDLSKAQDLKPRESAALRDCVDELRDSVQELRNSISEMGDAQGKSFELKLEDIQTWVSAALTDDDTCMDGFGESRMNGYVKTTVRSHIVRITHMTSNALALVNSYAKTL